MISPNLRLETIEYIVNYHSLRGNKNLANDIDIHYSRGFALPSTYLYPQIRLFIFFEKIKQNNPTELSDIHGSSGDFSLLLTCPMYEYVYMTYKYNTHISN